MFIDRNQDQLGICDVNALAIQPSFRFNFDFDCHAGCSLTRRARHVGHDVTSEDGCNKFNPIDRRCDPSVDTVLSCFDVPCLVNMAEDNATKDTTLMVGIPGHHQNP